MWPSLIALESLVERETREKPAAARALQAVSQTNLTQNSLKLGLPFIELQELGPRESLVNLKDVASHDLCGSCELLQALNRAAREPAASSETMLCPDQDHTAFVHPQSPLKLFIHWRQGSPSDQHCGQPQHDHAAMGSGVAHAGGGLAADQHRG